MNFAKSDIQTMLLDSAERLLAETSGVEYWRGQRSNPLGFDEARWAQFAELGWLALPVPEAAGGLDGTIEDVALLNIALGKALATEPYVSSIVLGTQILKHVPDAGDAMGEIATGALRVALAHGEPGADPLAIDAVGTVARRTADGFIVSGAKIMVLDAASAARLIVSARIEGEDGIALFLVPIDAEGLSADHYPLIDGSRAADIRFTEARLPADALLIGGNSGEAVLDEALHRAGVALMAQAVGAMEACIGICGDYTKERKQFGVAIGSFQAIQHILAEMFVATHQARSMLYHAIAHGNKPSAERAAALSAARIVIGEAGQLVSRNGIQVHGGYGLTDEYAVSHYFRRLMSLEKQYGDLIGHTTRFGDSLFGGSEPGEL
jgi:alkylation response protein AidB-like acyl-CoA dehydrogenase